MGAGSRDTTAVWNLVLLPFFVKIAVFLVLKPCRLQIGLATSKVTLLAVLSTRRTALLEAARPRMIPESSASFPFPFLTLCLSVSLLLIVLRFIPI